MKLIKTTEELSTFCDYASRFEFVTIDTEFLREKTYYSQLCLVQMAVKDNNPESAVIIDVLAHGIDLSSLHKLMINSSIVKVFHAARQDIEIFYNLTGVVPSPIFDTQIAAMVCGFGEQVGYDNLVKSITSNSIDKSSRFTDWSRRPLTKEQLDYAIGDVTHLRDVYEYLQNQLEKNGRISWVEEEMAVLTSENTYNINPYDAWKKIKVRTDTGKFLAILREVACFREEYAQLKNIPKGRVLKDDALIELCSVRPTNYDDLKRLRLYNRGNKSQELGDKILKAVSNGVNCAPENHPSVSKDRKKENKNPALSELLRVLLKSSSEKIGVAQKLIATTSDLDRVAAGERVGAVFEGWRLKVFGRDALNLCDGKIGLSADGHRIKIINVS
jgi:ribonuclease D